MKTQIIEGYLFHFNISDGVIHVSPKGNRDWLPPRFESWSYSHPISGQTTDEAIVEARAWISKRVKRFQEDPEHLNIGAS